jgi:hypothetical protein
MARKDVGLMLATASTDAPLATLPGVAARMDAALGAGHAADDYGAIAFES